MRKNEIAKSILLGILIVVCIIQTTMLWLGGIPGQNFFNQMQVEARGVNPFGIWVTKPSASNAGTPSSFAYKLDQTIEDTKREYERLVTKLQMILKSPGMDYKKIEEIQGIGWEELFSIPTIVYEYKTPLTINEISGSTTEASTIRNIDKVIAHSNTKFEKSIILSFISTLEDKLYRIEIPGDFKEFSKVYDFFTTEEMLKGVTKYQPSAISNVKEYVKGNSFMPIASMKSPIEYDILTVYNPISLVTEYGMKTLEKYVNGFFINPLLKNVEYGSDGSIIFTEEKKSIVMYNPKGVIEYINLSPKQNNVETTTVSGYNVAMDFIETTDSISDATKRGLYLSRLEQKGQEITYYFDMSYDGYQVALSRTIKDQLGIESLVKITIKNNQIISSSLCTLQFEPEIVKDEPRRAWLKTEYVEPINEALAVILNEGNESVVFDNVETVYLVNTLEGMSYMTRGVRLDGRWYYP